MSTHGPTYTCTHTNERARAHTCTQTRMHTPARTHTRTHTHARARYFNTYLPSEFSRSTDLLKGYKCRLSSTL